MSDRVKNCYDQLAADFHLIFEDWEASMRRQAAAIGPLLERECAAPRPLRILDCACGIGTQALGLAGRGHQVTGCDLSGAAVARARREAAQRGLQLQLFEADMLDLTQIPGGPFDAVVCLDNSLPHLDDDEDLLQAAGQILRQLTGGGILLASVRDYDRLVRERPVVHGPAFHGMPGSRRIVHQIWDWADERRYTFHLYITRETAGGWEAGHYAAAYRAVLRQELTAILERAGFDAVRWLEPAESGFYQPVVMARAGPVAFSR
jgi:glycine/sarcosine N-methyltransferase